MYLLCVITKDRLDIQLEATELSVSTYYVLDQSGFPALAPLTHLQELRILGSGGRGRVTPWEEFPKKPKKVKRWKKRRLGEGRGAGQVEGECEGWEQRSQAKTSPFLGKKEYSG